MGNKTWHLYGQDQWENKKRVNLYNIRNLVWMIKKQTRTVNHDQGSTRLTKTQRSEPKSYLLYNESGVSRFGHEQDKMAKESSVNRWPGSMISITIELALLILGLS